jgi:hypothetical protein
VIRAGLRRFAILAVALGLGTLVFGSLLGLATGSSARRGAAIGLYAVGAFCTVIGAGVAMRNAFQIRRPGTDRAEADEATGADRELAGILIVLGLLLVVAAVAIDNRAQLV